MFMFRKSSQRLLPLDTLDLIIPVGISGYEQDLPDFAPGLDAGFFVNEDHQIHSLCDERLLRRARGLCDEAFEPDQSTKGIVRVDCRRASGMPRIPGFEQCVRFNARENVKAFADDPDLPLLVSLEEFDPETKRATKTAIFDRRTLERYRPVDRVEAASEALLVSLNETSQISWPRMESLTGRRAAELQDELGSLVYRNPEGGAWETADRYLSGNVRAKLAVAQASEQIDPAYPRNVEALRAVQPKDLEPGDIEARLGSSWIPPSDIRDFVADLLDVPCANVKIGYAEIIATWTIELDYGARYVVNNTTTHGTARFRASELIEQSLNGRTPTAYDEDADGNRIVNQPESVAAREKQQQLKNRFRDWVWEDRERAARLAQEYNFRFNNIRLRDFDGFLPARPLRCA